MINVRAAITATTLDVFIYAFISLFILSTSLSVIHSVFTVSYLTRLSLISRDTSSSSSYYYNVSEANKVTVYLYNDDTEYEGTIVGTDELTDLAVIKIDKTGLTAAKLGDSDNTQVGEFVMAVGNPLSLQSSISAGIVSAVNRKVTSDGKTFTLIQTDTAINSGNSGGALVNSNGEVIGINQAIYNPDNNISNIGIGFAIPINEAKRVLANRSLSH